MWVCVITVQLSEAFSEVLVLRLAFLQHFLVYQNETSFTCKLRSEI